MIQEIRRKCASGYLALVILPHSDHILDGWLFYKAVVECETHWVIFFTMLGFVIITDLLQGLFHGAPQPGQGAATVRHLCRQRPRKPACAGPTRSIPRRSVSLRVRNFESEPVLKVNDSSGNPVDIAAVVVWKVVDSAEAIFEVDDYQSFVHIQSEAALRNLATSYPYEIHSGEEIALRSSPQEIAGKLQIEVQNRLDKAGVQVIEARISHLAYAEEIASAMLKRQQAQAIVAARRQIVDGAVGMVKLALDELKKQDVIELDEERKAAMISNLLVVLCGEENAQPILNTGSLYS